ncbi:MULTISPECIES: Maf family protein [Corynebacterium]|uniref:Maf family protein n=1 Tax=Corynebacterium TaxID=1716 RepID=UPI0006669D6F|nr:MULTISPECIES: nucleoside triphosphate pyrophosphatase [Corynebacterium]OHR34314.1 septum formation inhibitor Maf [Corynebacterium sp. HMSC074C05]TXS79417.1 septum formation inhibitor Maf [Corynebacterium sp. LK12]STC40916.1 Maf-like protein [Corynebacterium amycolatum]
MSSPRIVLASTSPSRLHILRSAGIEPITVAPNVDEDAVITALPDASPVRIVEELAQAKAHAVSPAYSNDIVIGGDSMLLLDGKLQGKPHTEEKTIERWHQQSGRTAELITGHCVVTPKGEHLEVAITSLDFAEVPEEDIRAYAATGEPLKCAGAFTLEALGGWFVDGINGDSSSVIGLSLPVVRRALYRYGYSVSQFWNR